MPADDVQTFDRARGVAVMRRALAFTAALAAIIAAPIGTLDATAGTAGRGPTFPEIAGAPTRHAATITSSVTGGNLAFHSGRVLTTNNVYLIYWAPAGVDSVVTTKVPGKVGKTFQTIVSQFFFNVAHDSGKSSNVYYSDTQYYNSAGQHVSYNVTWKGAYLDRHALPSNGCTISVTRSCLSNAQLKNEISHIVTANKWAVNSNSIIFMLTGYGIGSCYSSTFCSFLNYCAYHANITLNGLTTQFVNMPYTDTSPVACDSGNYPNGDPAADSVISMASHEHNETITDSTTTAWYDSRGYENGDKCSWNFGTILGGLTGHKYNQIINTHHYYLQREWSNRLQTCVQTGT